MSCGAAAALGAWLKGVVPAGRSVSPLREHWPPQGKPQDLSAYLKALEPLPDNARLVGHEPGLSGLIALLLSGSRGWARNFKKAALCKLTLTSLTVGRGAILEWLLPPKQMSFVS